MAETIAKYAKSNKKILVIVGDAHVQGIKRHLEAKGYAPQTEGTLYHKKDKTSNEIYVNFLLLNDTKDIVFRGIDEYHKAKELSKTFDQDYSRILEIAKEMKAIGPKLEKSNYAL